MKLSSVEIEKICKSEELTEKATSPSLWDDMFFCPMCKSQSNHIGVLSGIGPSMSDYDKFICLNNSCLKVFAIRRD